MVWNKGLKGEEYQKHYKNGFGGTQNKGRYLSQYPLVYDKNWLMEQHYGFDKTIQEMADMIGCKKQHIYNRMYELDIPIIDDIRYLQRDEQGRKQCIECLEWKPEESFVKNRGRKDGLTPYCAECKRYNQYIYEMNKKIIALFIYSDGYMKCESCGEENIDLLTFDHIHNDGAAHRKSLNDPSITSWAFKNNFPPTLRVLCRNCNWLDRMENGNYPSNKK